MSTYYYGKQKDEAQVNVTLLSDGYELNVDETVHRRGLAQDRAEQDAVFWTPWIVKPIGFLTVAVCTLTLLALSEYAVRSLPSHNAASGGLWAQSNETSTAQATSRMVTLQSNSIPAPIVRREPTPYAVSSIGPGSVPGSTSSSQSTAYSSSSSLAISTSPASAYLSSKHSILGSSMAPSSDFLDSEHSIPAPTTVPSAYLNSVATRTSSYVYSAASSAYLTGVFTEAASDFVNSVASLTSTSTPMTTNADAHATSFMVSEASHSWTNPPPSKTSMSVSTTPASTSTYGTAFDLVSPLPGCSAPPTSTTVLIQTYTLVAYTDLPKNLSIPASKLPSDRCGTKVERVTVTVYPWWASLIAALVPVTIVVVYNQLWQVVYMSIKALDPFAQLSNPNGALAKNALFLPYVSGSLPQNPFEAAFKGAWLLWFATLAYMISQVLASFSSEMLLTDTHSCRVGDPLWDVSKNHPNNPNPCFPELQAALVPVRVFQVLLVSLVALLFFMAVVIFRRGGSQIYANPSSITGVAPLIHHPQLLHDFMRIPPGASTKDLQARLGERRYRLAEYEHKGTVRYGIVPVWTAGDVANQDTTRRARKESNRLWLPYLMDSILLAVVVGLNACIIVYWRDGSDDGFNKFFNSDTFGPRFILTGTATIISTQWRRIRTEVSTKSVMAALSRGNAKTSSTISAIHRILPLSSLVHSLTEGRWLSAFLSFIVILADILCIIISGIPFHTGELRIQFKISTLLSIAILSTMSLCLLFVAVWRMNLPYIPRDPTCLANIISYIPAAGGLMRACEGLEFMNSQERDKYLAHKRWCYTVRDGDVATIDLVEPRKRTNIRRGLLHAQDSSLRLDRWAWGESNEEDISGQG